MGFTTSLKTESIGNRIWELIEGLVYIDKTGLPWTVPAGFRCDMYSVPRLLWWIYPPATGDRDRAAVLHDFMVRNRNLLNLTLMDCHRHFRDAMESVGVNRVRRNIKYAGVVCGNWLCAGKGDGLHSDERYNNPEALELIKEIYVTEPRRTALFT